MVNAKDIKSLIKSGDFEKALISGIVSDICVEIEMRMFSRFAKYPNSSVLLVFEGVDYSNRANVDDDSIMIKNQEKKYPIKVNDARIVDALCEKFKKYGGFDVIMNSTKDEMYVRLPKD